MARNSTHKLPCFPLHRRVLVKSHPGLWIFVATALAAFALGAASVQASTSAPRRDAFVRDWLVCGPFPNEDGSGFYRDYLPGSGGEAAVFPTPGMVQGVGDTWTRLSARRDGYVDLLELLGARSGVAYAFATVENRRAEPAVFTIGGNGGLQVWVNGNLVHHNRLYRKPGPGDDAFVAELKPGTNRVLVKIEGRGSRWGFFLERFEAKDGLFVNERSIILPDLRIGKRPGAWAQVEVTNATLDGADLGDLRVEVVGSDLFLPSRFDADPIPAGETDRLPVWLASRRPVTESDTLAVELRVSAGNAEVSLRVKPRLRRRDEFFVTTYQSGVDGSVQPYSVLLPSSYDARYPYPLIVLLHGAWVTDWGQNMISYRRKEWAIQVAVHDRGNNRYTEIGQVDLFEVMQEIRRRYNIDDDRVYLAGHSMGGYGTWFHGTRHPDLWAALSPQAGYADYFLYHPAMRKGRAVPKFRRRLLEEASPLLFAENLLQLPAYVIHGAKDQNVSVEHARRMTARLAELGYRFIYDENPDAGHWWGPRGKYWGTEVVDKPPIYEFFQKFRRDRWPRNVVYKTSSLRYNRAYWVTIDDMDSVNAMAEIRAEVVGGRRIEVRTDNVARFTLDLQPSLVDADSTVRVTVNGQGAYTGLLPLAGRLTLCRGDDGGFFRLLHTGDVRQPGASTAGRTQVAALPGPEGKAEGYRAWGPRHERPAKTHALFGPLSDAFNSPFLFVVGESSSEVEWTKANRRAAHWAAVDWRSRANGRVRIKSDGEVTWQDIQDFNLVLFGDPGSNRWLERINQDLPIRFEGERLVAGDTPVGRDDAGLLMIYPNPLNPQRYVVVVGGTTPGAMRRAHRVGFTSLPDYVVFDRESLVQGETAYPMAGFFDKNWRLRADDAPDGR